MPCNKLYLRKASYEELVTLLLNETNPYCLICGCILSASRPTSTMRMALVLNQVWPVCAWFLKIVSVWTSVYVQWLSSLIFHDAIKCITANGQTMIYVGTN